VRAKRTILAQLRDRRIGIDLGVIDHTIASIGPLDENARRVAQARLDSLTKPRGSLGYLEEIVQRFAAIRHDGSAARGRGAMAVFVADHGIADEGVSAYPKAVTVEMLRNFARGGAAICVLARRLALELTVVDVGVATDTRAENLAGVTYRRGGPGTVSFIRGPAMTRDQALGALETGIEVAGMIATKGAALIGIGEMGIGNSTSAAALLSALSGIAPEELAGYGTGLDASGLRRKIATIEQGLRLHREFLSDAILTLAALGGFEIAAMAGACLGAAAARIPIVIDGFIATAAAAIAEKLRPGLSGYFFFSHRSAEGGHALALQWINARPILDLGMRLGEGTGAALAIATIQAALDLFHEMATFAQAEVSGKL
jgi:nicotinate-nucleotide--dimethylbenzimidazole phosphoribosyltransferase